MVGVDGDIGLPVRRRVHRCLDFREGELVAEQGIGGRRVSAARHDLDLRGAVTKIFARRGEDLGHAVDDITMALPYEFRR
jgi:hypothetical protein